MKKIISTLASSMTVFLVCGQQKLAYNYDAAGNRTNRTIVVAAQAISALEGQPTASLVYIDSLDGKEISIHMGKSNSPILVSIKGFSSSSSGNLAVINRSGKILVKEPLSGETASLKLDNLPAGSYTLRILLNQHASIWKLVRL